MSKDDIYVRVEKFLMDMNGRSWSELVLIDKIYYKDVPDKLHTYLLLELGNEGNRNCLKSPIFNEPYLYPHHTYSYRCYFFDDSHTPINIGDFRFDWIKSHI